MPASLYFLGRAGGKIAAFSAVVLFAAGCATSRSASRHGPITERAQGPDFVTARGGQLQASGMDRRAAAQLAHTEKSLGVHESSLRYKPISNANSFRISPEQAELERRLSKASADRLP